MDVSFDAFVDGTLDYDPVTKGHTSLWLMQAKADIGGGRIGFSDIDELKNHPDTDTVTVSGLRQDTFEYLISTYGKQLKAIRFFKNKLVEDWSALGDLPQLEYVYYFHNLNKDLTFLSQLENLQTYDFPTNLYTTEQVAWIAANYPKLSGFAIRPYTEHTVIDYNRTGERLQAGWVVGKRKPHLIFKGNEEKLKKYADRFEALKEAYRGVPYHTAFPET